MSTSIALAVSVAIGAAAGVFGDPAALGSARWLAAVFGVAAFAAAAKGHRRIAKWTARCALIAATALAGADAQYRALHPPLRSLLNERFGGFDIESIGSGRQDNPVVIEGRLATDATLTAAGAQVRVRVSRVAIDACPEPAAGSISLAIAGALAADAVDRWRAGRTIRAPVVLRRPARYLNAGVPDHERLLARRGIALVGSVKSAALIDVIEHGAWWDEWASELRVHIRRAMTRYVGHRDPQAAAVAVAILIGDRGALDPDVERRLQEAGTYHVIAISGGNIAILAGLILGALWIAGIRDGWAAGAAAALLAAYAFVAGGGPSVARATLMAVMYLLLRIIDQHTAPVHALALAIAVILIGSPLAIADVGLWLTFGATGAIVAFTSKVAVPSPRWLRPVIALMLASIAAELLLMPIGAFVFQRVTIAGLAVNLVAVPCMAIVQVASLIVAFAHALHVTTLADLAGWVTYAAVRGLVDSATLVDVAPWLTWRVPSPAVLVLAAYYAAALLWFLTRSRACVTVAATLFAWIAIAPPTLARVHGDGRLHLTVLDVGQGDAILATFPNGRTLMVDAGGVSLSGDFDIGDRIIGPALRARGISRLDYLAITHGDPDHIGGAASIVTDFAPSEIWYGIPVDGHEPTQKLLAAAERRRAGWRWLLEHNRIEIGGVELRVHHPRAPDWQRPTVRNDDSLVFELRYGQVSILLTGDVGADVERELIPKLDLLPIVVLKSPHHGSATSSSAEFINAVKPALVVVSSGRANPYGHPVPPVLERYKAIGARVLRTDQLGQIEIVTDGQTLNHEGHEEK